MPRSRCSVAVVCLFLAAALPVAARPDSRIEKSEPWARIMDGEYLVENNTWNIKAAQSDKWQQTIFADPATGSRGWRWAFTGENDVLKTYPEIIFGLKPYAGYVSTTKRLPIPLADARFRLEYDYVAKAQGAAYNTTTDICFTDSTTPVGKNIRAKLMIWFDHQNVPFFTQGVTRAVIDGRPHQVFIDHAHDDADGKWVFIALLPENLPARGELNLTEYFRFLQSAGALQPEWFLSSIETGSEIASGVGEVTFKRFVVH
jgi:hypothetical protein